MNIGQPISYKLLEEVISELTGNTPIIIGQDIVKSDHAAPDKVWRITASTYTLQNGQQRIFWQLPGVDKKMNFDVANDIDVRYILYNAFICYIIHTKQYNKTNRGEVILLNDLDKLTIILYTCVFLQRNISESFKHTHLLSTILKYVWIYYLENASKYGQLKRTNQELLEAVYHQSVNNKPFDYLTDGINIIEVYEQNPPF